MRRGRDAARPARYGPESGAARHAGRDDGQGPRVSDRGRGEARLGQCWAGKETRPCSAKGGEAADDGKIREHGQTWLLGFTEKEKEKKMVFLIFETRDSYKIQIQV
jgi:hypothetical protein